MRTALPRLLGALAGAAFLGILAYDLVVFLIRDHALAFTKVTWPPGAPPDYRPWPEILQSLKEPISAEALGWLLAGIAFPALLLTPTPRGRIPVTGEWIAAAASFAGFLMLLLTLPWSSTWTLGGGDLAGLRLLWVVMIGAYPAVLLIHDGTGRIAPERARWVRAVLYAALVMVPWIYIEAVGSLARTDKPYDPLSFRALMDLAKFAALVVAFRYAVPARRERPATVSAGPVEDDAPDTEAPAAAR